MPEPSIPPRDSGAQQPNWIVPFVLFLAGIIVLIIASKAKLQGLADYGLKGLGAAFCIVGFLFARRTTKPAK